jgi:endoglucanase
MAMPCPKPNEEWINAPPNFNTCPSPLPFAMSRSFRRRRLGLGQPHLTLLSSLLFVLAGFVVTVMLWSMTPISLAQPTRLSTRSPQSLWAQRPMESQNWVQTPLSTRGSDIVDRTGRSLLLRGVNWFGIETENHAPHGLWTRNYRDLIIQIKDLGYNFIRLPYSVQMMRDQKVQGIDFNLNPELKDKKPIEIMDAIIQEAGRQGIMVLLDSHRLNNQRIPELWYGDGFMEEDWIKAWTDLAIRYKDQPNVLART